MQKKHIYCQISKMRGTNMDNSQKCFSSRLHESIETRCQTENDDVAGSAMLQLHLSDQQFIAY